VVLERHARARAYLSPASTALWRWSEDGRVVVWNDGRTIAFRQEVRAVLERLAPLGLPPFESIVLVLSACHAGYLPRAMEYMALGGGIVGRVVGAILKETSGQVMQGLCAVAELPEELRARAKPVIVESILETAAVRVAGSPIRYEACARQFR